MSDASYEILRDLLTSRSEQIAQRWFSRAINAYQPDSAAAFTREKNQFANPVGHALSSGCAVLVPLLIAAESPEALRTPLAPIIKMRAIQDFTPSQAVSFVFLLKPVLREELAAELANTDLEPALRRIEARIDRMALVAFDLYAECREQYADIRVGELKRRVGASWERRLAKARRPETEPTDNHS